MTWPVEVPRRLEIDEWVAMHGPVYPCMNIWVGAEEIGMDCEAFDADMGWARVLVWNESLCRWDRSTIHGKITVELTGELYTEDDEENRDGGI